LRTSPPGRSRLTGTHARIGVLVYLYPPDADPPQAFSHHLHDLGYVEGQNVVLHWRYAQGREDRLPALAAELIRLKPDVIVADGTLAVRAAMQATSTIPIVMIGTADPVGGGLVSNLARPGGNVTGRSLLLAEMTAKRLQLLKEAAPKVSRVGVLWNPATPFHKAMLREVEAAAPSLGLQPVPISKPR
jgi:putative ABC transport system substrate-binding protein